MKGDRMRDGSILAITAGLALVAASGASAQSAASPPQLTAEQAIQLFEEAGFSLQDGRPVNRCGNPVNPRIAFIDLNADGGAEAHIGDVDPACYGKPGAWFAILAQQADKSWKRLIGEDGIVGFEASRSQGWNDLSLETRDSACPGLRRFNGTDYGAPTACAGFAAAPAPHTASPGAEADAASLGQTEITALRGTRPERIAQLLRNILATAPSRSYETIMAAFPGTDWEQRTTYPLPRGGTVTSQSGSIDLGGVTYLVDIEGTPERVTAVALSGPENDNLPWEPIEAAIRASGFQSRNIGCHSPTGFGYVRLTDGDHTAILHKFLNYGTMVPSTDHYVFTLDDPFHGGSEAAVAADRSLC